MAEPTSLAFIPISMGEQYSLVCIDYGMSPARPLETLALNPLASGIVTRADLLKWKNEIGITIALKQKANPFVWSKLEELD